jgi:hypothetical protein
MDIGQSISSVCKHATGATAHFLAKVGLENHTFLTLGFAMQRTNIYADTKEQVVKGFSNTPENANLDPI